MGGFFEPSVNSIVECLKSMATGTDPEKTVSWFSRLRWQQLYRLLVCFPRWRFWCKSVDIPGSRACDRCPRIKTVTPRCNVCSSPKCPVRSFHARSRNRAVTVGAISYYLDRFVVGRIVRHTYGTPGSVNYDPSNPEHVKRSQKKYLAITGAISLDVFSPTLFKVIVFVFRLHAWM